MDKIGAIVSLWKVDVWPSAPLTPTLLVHTKLVELGMWLESEAERSLWVLSLSAMLAARVARTRRCIPEQK